MPLAIGSAFPRNRKYSPSFLPPQKNYFPLLPAITLLLPRYLPTIFPPTSRRQLRYFYGRYTVDIR